jgi:hypothetical protein
MNTLNISQIFSQFSFYQDHYLALIQDPAQYFTVVQGAEISLWPLATQQLYLGDLLQLWFAEKWLVEQERQYTFEVFLNAEYLGAEQKELYIYALHGNLVTGSNQSKVWQASIATSKTLGLANVSKHYFEYRALTKPKQLAQVAGQAQQV